MATYIWSTAISNAYIGIPSPESITLNKSSITLTTIWQTEQLTATLTPTVCDQRITWSSDDTTIATVSTSWLVTCVTPWTCTITATTVNGLTASCSVAEWRLPSIYQEVEWIGNSWTQYIDTWVAIPNHKAIANIEYTSLNTWMLLGCYLWQDSWVSWGQARLYGGCASTTGQRCYGFLGVYSESWWSISINTKYELEVSTISWNMYFKHDGTTFGTSSVTYSTSKAWNFWILGQNNNTSTWVSQVWEAWNSGKVYDYKIYDSSDELVRDFVPCYRIADWVIWMYDLVNNVFYTNDGTGTFTKWNDV